MENHSNEIVIYAQPTKIVIISYLFVLCFGLILGCGLVKYCSKNSHVTLIKEIRFIPTNKVKPKIRSLEKTISSNKVKSLPNFESKGWKGITYLPRHPIRYTITSTCWNCGKLLNVHIPKGTTKDSCFFTCPVCGIKTNRIK